ncbi:MAG: glycosyltransferase family 39 protein [Candidatus Komeilibacteria bacterium]|nr:glycosyltransferase family 39 protein [Candidatus Komeilibacteria bacterium]
MQLTTRQNISIALGIISLFGIIQSLMVWNGGRNGVFNSPDANANYYFAQRVFEGKGLGMGLPEPALDAHTFLYTRSTRVLQNMLVPSGFTGLVVLYGFANRLFFLNLTVFWTVLAACAGMWAFYRLTTRYFSRGTGLFSLFFLAVHPAWWYYTNDSLFPNVLFVSLILIAFWLLYEITTSPDARWYVYGGVGFFFAAALLVRSTEFVWITPLLIFILWRYWSILKKNMMVFSFAIAISVIMLCIAYIRLTSPLTTPFGYAFDGVRVATGAGLGSPFSFHPKLLVVNSWNYLFRIFWPYTLLFILSVALLWRSASTQLRALLYPLVYVTLALVLTYGSWRIMDSPDPGQVTIGTSFVRYFLPVYLLALPVIAEGFMRFREQMSAFVRHAVTSALLIGLAVFMYTTAIVGSPESIVSKYGTLRTYDAVAGWVISHTPGNSIIIANKSDKYLWPKRLVISDVARPEAAAALREIVETEETPVFYIGETMTTEVRKKINDVWNTAGIDIGESLYASGSISVYAARVRNNNE